MTRSSRLFATRAAPCACRSGVGAALLAGAAAALIAGSAHAASTQRPLAPIIAPQAQAKPAPPSTDDGLTGGGFYMEADQFDEDNVNHILTARGGVEARYQGRTVRADEVAYNTVTGVVTARGHVQIINPDGTAEFSDAVTLDRDMSEGVALGFSARLQQNVQLTAASADRKSPTLNDLHDAVFTPCPVCAKKPIPTWSIRAKEIVEDRVKQTIAFKDAVIEIHGIPVIYLPVFWEADPAAPRKSGFLVPLVGSTGTRGFSVDIPYLQVISPSQQIIVDPQINTKVNPFLSVDYRQRFYSGQIDVRAGYTYESDLTSDGDRIGPASSRSFILANGQFNINQDWKWGFTAEQVSDPLLFQEYDVPNTFQDHGLYAADDQRLISQLYVTRQTQNSYLSVAAISVQGLRPTDINSTFPTIAPLIEGRWEPDFAILGGRLRIDGSAVVLTRDASPTDPELPGTDSRRATLEANWQRSFVFSNGIRVDPFLDARTDLYSLSQLPAPYASNATILRGMGTIGATVSYPLFKKVGDVTYVIEPIAQIAISPNTYQDPRIPNEDSVDFEFDDTNLFTPNKSPGFDLYEGGQRLNVGGEASIEYADGRNANFLIGRSFAAEADPYLPARTGLATASSDWILSADATPMSGVEVFSRWRLDSGTLSINELEAGGDFVTSRVVGYVRYLQEAQDPSGDPVKDLDLKGDLYFTQHWGITLYGIRDFQAGAWRRQEIGGVYRDDCIRVELVYRHDETFNRTLGPSNSVVLRLTLATLGNSGYRP